MALRLRSATLRSNGTQPFVLSVAAAAAESKHTGMDRHHVESVLGLDQAPADGVADEASRLMKVAFTDKSLRKQVSRCCRFLRSYSSISSSVTKLSKLFPASSLSVSSITSSTSSIELCAIRGPPIKVLLKGYLPW